MTAEIVDIASGRPIGAGIEIDPDKVLYGARGARSVVVVSVDKDGVLHVAGSHSPNAALWLLERGKLKLLLGDQVETPEAIG